MLLKLRNKKFTGGYPAIDQFQKKKYLTLSLNLSSYVQKNQRESGF